MLWAAALSESFEEAAFLLELYLKRGETEFFRNLKFGNYV